MKRAAFSVICATIGFAIAVYFCTTPPSLSVPIWLQAVISYVLCPPGILAGLTATDPDHGSTWFFFAPINAFIYGLIGFGLWRKVRTLRILS